MHEQIAAALADSFGALLQGALLRMQMMSRVPCMTQLSTNISHLYQRSYLEMTKKPVCLRESQHLKRWVLLLTSGGPPVLSDGSWWLVNFFVSMPMMPLSTRGYTSRRGRAEAFAAPLPRGQPASR